MNSSNKLRVGLVSEGPSDWLVLEAVMRSLNADIEFERLRPDVTLTNQQPGWRGVRAWCQENGRRLEVLMKGVIGRPLHLLVVHVDCSMADKVDAERPCPPATDTSGSLRQIIGTSWINHSPVPSFLLIACPAQCHESWIVATLDPPYKNLANIECDKTVENELARLRLLRRNSKGEVKKQAVRYQPLAEREGQMFDLVCERCGTAAEFRRLFLLAVPLNLEDSA
jgi:hypothetical protein